MHKCSFENAFQHVICKVGSILLVALSIIDSDTDRLLHNASSLDLFQYKDCFASYDDSHYKDRMVSMLS